MSKQLNNTVGLRRKSVLIVDDNLNVQMTLTDIVTAAGFDSVIASSRKEAIAICDRRAFDVAFVDKRLVENDSRNQDGLAILRYINGKNEGTYSILLTGYGEFDDAVQLSDELSIFKPMRKSLELAEMEEKIREALTKAAVYTRPALKNGSSIRIWCGNDAPGPWQNKAYASLSKPVVGILGLNNLLDDLAETCTPLLERANDNGIQKTETQATMAGLYWSRGVGSAVVVLLAKGKIPDTMPRLDTWPQTLQFESILYQLKRKNLVGAIVKCTGVGHTEFTVPRQQME
jgi:ActR/RegA family two-component response regulator